MRMDYAQAVSAAMGDFRGLAAQLYLDTLDLLEKEKIADFDLKKFRQDLEDLFAGQGWIVSV